MCVNIVTESSDLHHFDASLRSQAVHHEVHQTEWVGLANNGVNEILQFLTSTMGTINKKQWEGLTKTIGWNLNPYGLLGFGRPGELDIRPIRVIQSDYMRILIVSGVWNHGWVGGPTADTETGGLFAVWSACVFARLQVAQAARITRCFRKQQHQVPCQLLRRHFASGSLAWDFGNFFKTSCDAQETQCDCKQWISVENYLKRTVPDHGREASLRSLRRISKRNG